MMNNTTFLNNVSLNSSMSFNIGISYVIIGIIFTPFHIICSHLIFTDKEMKNPTYQFIINLSIVDMLELISICFYAGSILLIGGNQIESVARFMTFWAICFWYIS